MSAAARWPPSSTGRSGRKGGTSIRSIRGLALSGIVAGLLILPAPVVGREPLHRTAGPAHPAADLAPALAADGAFHGSAAVNGTVDAGAWSLVSNLAAAEAPRFAPAAIAAATPIGPWSALGSNGSGNGALWNGSSVRAIAVSGSNVYVGGVFENAAGIATADNVAMWNGTAWSALGSNGAGDGALDHGPGTGVFALTLFGSDLVVGGIFTNASGIATADYLASWNGSAWSGLGSNEAGNGAICCGRVWALAVSGSNLFVGGEFSNVAGDPSADFIATWNGSTWSTLPGMLPGPALNGYVAAIAIGGSNAYIGGAFQDAAGIASADYLAVWSGVSWSAVGSNGPGSAISSTVLSLAATPADLYAGGSFINAGGIATADHIARWNGATATWSALGSDGVGSGALNSDVLELAVSGTNLYVGGGFTNAGGIAAADHVAKWNGNSWWALGSNGSGDGALSGPVSALAITPSAGAMYVGGDFSNAAGIATADRVARWGLTPFTDIGGSPFESDIAWVYFAGITSGCTATTFCPNANVTRGEMASFLARALHLPNTTTDYFTDDGASIHQNNINRMAEAGITTGCTLTTFCPTANVSRAQMATFLSRALLLPSTPTDFFTDDNGSPYESSINRVAAAGITSGCTATTYCPNANVSRGQMAAFLHRGFGP